MIAKGIAKRVKITWRLSST